MTTWANRPDVDGPVEWHSDGHAVPVVDLVNQPPHYIFEDGVEVIDLTEQLNFNCGNAVKYVARAGRKDPEKAIEDLQKAAFYVAKEIARVQRRAAERKA